MLKSTHKKLMQYAAKAEKSANTAQALLCEIYDLLATIETVDGRQANGTKAKKAKGK